MLYLLAELGTDRYAFDARQLVEVLPVLEFKQIPHAPVGVAGVFNYHGAPTPLLDLTQLMLGRPSKIKMSTRIVVTWCVDPSGEKHLLGLLAERATETFRRNETDFVASGVAVDSSRYLGPVAVEADGLVQRIEISELVPVHLRRQLFAELVGAH
jgi:chemotaxis-related protein WspB